MQQDKADDYVIYTGETHSVSEFLTEGLEITGLGIEKLVRIDLKIFPSNRR